MIEHVYRRTAAARSIADVIVATDDARIARAVERFGGRVQMTLPTHRSGTERLAEVAASLACDVVVNVQGDEPLIAPQLVSEVSHLLETSREAPVSTACHEIHDEASRSNPNIVKVVLDARGYALYFSRAQIPYPREAGGRWYRHAGIYGYRAGFLKEYARLPACPLEKTEALEQLRVLWHGHRIAVAVSEAEIPPGVDTPRDLEAVRKMLA